MNSVISVACVGFINHGESILSISKIEQFSAPKNLGVFLFQPFQTPFTKFSKVIEMNISDTSRVNNAHIWWHTTILAPTMGAASQLMTAKRINYSDNQTFFPFKTKLETQF